jgi:hypothetical protein
MSEICRTQKWDAQLKASTEDDCIKFFPGLVAEPNFPALDLPDPRLNGNPTLSNERQEMLAQCPPND